ncbi:MAG: hypothetical protein VCA38_03535 [Roseibacillus sp.]|jgi:hypothetical protein
MARLRPALPLITVAAATLMTALVHGQAPEPGGGRFLFAGDDDWDWATPLGAEEACKLVRYGAMAWSALDWAEGGLDQVRGVIVGTPPDANKTMTLANLSDLRGEKATYSHRPQARGVFKDLLEGERPPNLIILMQNTGKDGVLEAEAITTLIEFVKEGGRLVVLDDWKKYQPVLKACVDAALTLPVGPPIPIAPEAKPPDPAAAAPAKPKEPKPEPPAPPDPTPGELTERLTELVPKLADDSFKVREGTSAEIRELGPKVLNLLAEIKSDDPEISARIEQLQAELRPKPAIVRRPKVTREQRAAIRNAKHKFNAELVKTAATRLSEKKISHQMSDALVDGDKKILPVLRISFPVAK